MINFQKISRSIHIKGAILFILILLLAVTTGCKREKGISASTTGKTSIAELEGLKVLFREVSSGIPCRTINVSDGFLSANADALKNLIKAVDEANAIILANPTAENIVAIAVKYTGAPQAAIIHGNHRLGFRTSLAVDGLIALGDELLLNNDIRENPGTRLFADAFKGITW